MFMWDMNEPVVGVSLLSVGDCSCTSSKYKLYRRSTPGEPKVSACKGEAEEEGVLQSVRC
jgi:hypothetical protein